MLLELVSATGQVDEDARYEQIRTEALDLTRQLGEVRDRIEALLGQRAYLRFTLLAQRGEGAPQPPLSEVRSTLSCVGEAEAKIAKELREQEESGKDLGEKLQPLLVKMNNPLATGQIARVEIETGGGKVDVGLRYQVNGASWMPSYNARLLDDDTVELEYFGVVHQGTGEDWTDAHLSLSTANASGGAALPTLVPWYLGRESQRFSLDPGSLAYPIPLRPGQVSTFVGADYLGSSSTTAVVAGEALRLSFGADDRLKVTRQLLSRRQEFIGSGKRTTRYHVKFRITVSNYSGEARRIELRDQLPISELEKVTVKTIALTEGSVADPSAGPGIRVWDLQIPDGAEKVVDLEFTVTAPTDVAYKALQSMQMLF